MLDWLKKHQHHTLRIDQFLQSYGKFDAIGNEVNLLQQMLQELGFDSEIFAVEGHLTNSKAQSTSQYLKQGRSSDIAIHHFSIATDLLSLLEYMDAYIVTRYHNITPSHFFCYPGMDEGRYKCFLGRKQLPVLQRGSSYYLAASDYNARELKSLGFKSGRVLPVIRDYYALTNHIDNPLIKSGLKRKKGHRVLFVGRMIPSKAQHDLILFISLYRRYIDPCVSISLVGGYHQPYLETLIRICKSSGLSVCLNPKRSSDFEADVIIAAAINDQDLSTYYRHSDAFCSFSDHEGFGVPLIEAMSFGLPTLAHSAGAIDETVSTGGILFDKKDPTSFLKNLERIFHDQAFKDSLKEKAKTRSKSFTFDKLKTLTRESILEILKERASQAGLSQKGTLFPSSDPTI